MSRIVKFLFTGTCRKRANIKPFQISHVLRSYSTSVADYKDAIAADIDTIEQIRRQNMYSKDMDAFLYDRLDKEKNSYSYILNLISLVPRRFALHSSELSVDIVFTFSKWMEKNRTDEVLTSDLKRKALETVLFKKNLPLLQLVCNVYEINSEVKIMEDVIEKLLSQEKFEQAAYCIMSNSLQESYPYKNMLLPLLQNKRYSLIMQYITGYPEIQLKFAQLIDDMIGDFMALQIKSPAQKGRAQYMYRCLNSLILQFQLPQENYHNFQRVKNDSLIHFLIRKKTQATAANESWESIALSTVDTDRELQQKLIHTLVTHNDVAAALSLAEKFGWPEEDWPDPNMEQANENSDANHIPKTPIFLEERDTPLLISDYLSLDSQTTKIVTVENKEDFYKCLRHVTQPGSVVGIDSEWKPRTRAKLSLIQLAVGQTVYILDLISLSLGQTEWDIFLDEFCSNPDILKLGCGVIQDVQMIIESNRGSQNRVLKFSNFLDLAVLYDKMIKLYEGEFAVPDSSSTRGLSKLCEIILGKPICKKERVGNWEERPLSEAQVLYAALDAHCLVKMLDSMKARAVEHNTEFDKFLRISIIITTTMSKIVIKSNKKYHWIRDGSFSFCYKPIKFVKDLRIMIDSDLTDLDTKLRMYGIDVVVESFSNICKDSFRLLRESGRFLIAGDSLQEKVKGFVPDDQYFLVPKRFLDSEQNIVALIFRHFCLHVDNRSMFSRCLHCNGNDFRDVPSSELRKQWMSYSLRNKEETATEDNLTNEMESDDGVDTTSSSCSENEDTTPIKMDNLNMDLFVNKTVFKVCNKCGNVQ